jgi:hypothetical protein
MKWSQLAALCNEELESLRGDDLPDFRTFFPDPSAAVSTLLQHEQDTMDAVEAAIRQFSVHRNWPALTDLECTMLCLRLEYAVSLASVLAEQPSWSIYTLGNYGASAPDENTIPGFEWLLLFAWDHHGFPALQQTLARFLGAPDSLE